MKKITRFITAVLTLAAISLTPAAAYAQEVEVVPADDAAPAATTTPAPAGVPNTGIAPKNSILGPNVSVFMAGSLLGAGVGLGIVTLKRRRLNQ